MPINREIRRHNECAERPLRFVAALEPDCIETAFTDEAPLTIADLRPGFDDAPAYRRMRMEGEFMAAPIFKAFDAIAHIPTTTIAKSALAKPDSRN